MYVYSMKRIVILLSVLLLSAACTQVNTSAENTVTYGKDTLTNVNISVHKTDTVNTKISNKVLFKASGAEPGWFAEITQSTIKFVYNYGSDSLMIENKIGKIQEGVAFNYSVGDKNTSNYFNINSTIKNCNLMSGDVVNNTVSVQVNEKQFNGCGYFVK
jgi:uncharacterized membrane protein